MTDNLTPQESWNMATETLKRLSRDLDLCSFFSHKGDLVNWFYSAMTLRRNLYPFLEETEYNELQLKFISLPSHWIVNGRVNPKHYIEVHKALDEIYLLFVKHMKSKGILMPKTSDPRSAVLNM